MTIRAATAAATEPAASLVPTTPALGPSLYACNYCLADPDATHVAVKTIGMEFANLAPRAWVEEAQRLHLTSGWTCVPCWRRVYAQLGRPAPQQALLARAAAVLPGRPQPDLMDVLAEFNWPSTPAPTPRKRTRD